MNACRQIIHTHKIKIKVNLRNSELSKCSTSNDNTSLKIVFQFLIKLEENEPSCNFFKTFSFYMSRHLITSVCYFHNVKE